MAWVFGGHDGEFAVQCGQRPQGTDALDESGKGSGVGLLTNMYSGLWKSQLDRHGTDDESIPLDVSSREAEEAVH